MNSQDIICISSIDWDFIWQGHQEIMSSLAGRGSRVLFIENTGVRAPGLRDMPRLVKRIRNWLGSIKGIRRERENLFIYSPVILPFPYSSVARWINRRLITTAIKRWMRSVGSSSPVIWTFLPTGLALDIIDAIDNKLVVYYCIDNFSASSPQARRIRKTEKRLLEKADIVFVTAKNLRDFCLGHNKNVHIFPYGVNLDVYENGSRTAAKPPADFPGTGGDVVGYIGGIHKWMDFGLIKFLAKEHPDKQFVFVGPLQEDVKELKEIKNVHFLGQKSYAELPSYVARFKVCIIPYLVTDYTRNVYPTKINEYLCMGKPVVSTALPEVEAFNERNGDIIYIAKTKEEFSRFVGEAAKEKEISSRVNDSRRSVAAKEGSWKAKIENMCALIESEIARKEKEKSLNWKEGIQKLCRDSKRKAVPAAAAIIAVYLLIFHTPLVWWAASPLRAAGPLAKADAIVVLAGGVGESGRPGQGYEERVKYAAELYKKGYARHLVFSSGFRYAIKEAEVMKALAVSLGVAPDSIILEEAAANTYENIKFSAAIMAANNWKTAILVSSPYHMRRALLVCNRVAPGVHFIYAPIPYSLFYGDGRHVRLEHIIAIGHEYLGIAYYWFRGYI